jgi:hypothetical protein
MTRIKKILALAGAVGFCSSAVIAADLPVRKAETAEYVRVCSAYGNGFFVIPGTDTCLRIGGYVRSEYRFAQPRAGASRDSNITSFVTRANIRFDTRIGTEFGLLRTFSNINLNSNGTLGIDDAFVQFGGLTAGRTQSFFDFFTGNLYSLELVSDEKTNLLAYTASLGSGTRLSVALEDAAVRRFNTAGSGFSYGGVHVPDLVVALATEGGWGSAQLSAAVHKLQSDSTINRDAYGFAVQAGAEFRLPFLDGRDRLWLQGVYTDGALGYSGLGNITTARIGARASNAFFDGTSIRKGRAWALTGSYRRAWTSQIRQEFQVTYGRLELPHFIRGSQNSSAFNNADVLNVGTRLVWSPVSGLAIGADLSYRHISPNIRQQDIRDGQVAVAGGRRVGSDGIWAGRVRIQRSF